MKKHFQIKAITPVFSYGADPHQAGNRRQGITEHDGQPEIRAASIRGQLRRWMSLLGYGDAVNRIFGYAAGENGTASKIIVRVGNIDGQTGKKRTLEHKNWSTKSCFLPGTVFEIIIQSRRDELTKEDEEILNDTIEAWILMGTLGGRGTRGAGSIQLANNLPSESAWKERCKQLLAKTNVSLRLSRDTYQYENEARRVIADTLSEDAFNNQPLGGIQPRKTSPLKLRLVTFSDSNSENRYKIAALWVLDDTRPLEHAIHVLRNHRINNNPAPKEIGRILQESEVIKE